jgi:hypothetical protein
MSDNYEYTTEGIYGERARGRPVVLPRAPHWHLFGGTDPDRVCRPPTLDDPSCGKTRAEAERLTSACAEQVEPIE